MAYIKNEWVNQNVERPRTYQLNENVDGSVTLIDDFGQVTELGTPVNADNMNHIEDGVAGVAIRLFNLDEIFALDEWTKDGEKLYKSLQDQNQGHATSEVDWWEEVKLGGGQSAFSLFDYKFSDHIIKNLSWLLSTGQNNRKQDYPSMYEAIVKEQATPTTTGVSVKLSTESFTDYDYVLNKVDETFRLPLKVKLIGGLKNTAPVIGNGMTLGLTTGYYTYGLGYGAYTEGRYTWYGTPVGTPFSGQTGVPEEKSFGVTKDPTKSGIVADLSKVTDDKDLYLYFYVGDTVQNADIVDVADIKATKLDINCSNATPKLAESFFNKFTPNLSARINIKASIESATNTQAYIVPFTGWLRFMVYADQRLFLGTEPNQTSNDNDYGWVGSVVTINGDKGELIESWVFLKRGTPLYKYGTYAPTTVTHAEIFPLEGGENA